MATFALGTAAAAGSTAALEALLHVLGRLIARIDPAQERDHTMVAGFPRSTVRQNVAYALLRVDALPGSTKSVLRELIRSRWNAGPTTQPSEAASCSWR